MEKGEILLRACVSKALQVREGESSYVCGYHLFSQVEELNSIIKELTADSTKGREAPLKTQVSKFEVRVFINESGSLRFLFQERPGRCS